ncbi:unnamed protein product [Dracunculus medinensis]|uniref:C-type lectin domain-containing protein n=1 Tax=Dracunculus medinensis TaxID=318479 RepID=A0A0N4U656_DRAME|nr:unnamed protein product [Dracunculus medinensis]
MSGTRSWLLPCSSGCCTGVSHKIAVKVNGRIMFALLLLFLAFDLSLQQQQVADLNLLAELDRIVQNNATGISGVCSTDNECRVFEYCSFNRCVSDTRNCPGGTCPMGTVCIGNQCIRDPIIATTPLTAQVQRKCPHQWIFNQQFNACYFVGRGPYSYEGANTECTARGGHVASVHSMEEMNFINNLVGSGAYWIGLRKSGSFFPSFTWEDGSPVDFKNFRKSQPDNCCGVGAECTLVNYVGNKGEWDDASCNKLWRNPTNIVCKRAPQ